MVEASSSQKPEAIFDIKLADAGEINIASAPLDSFMCPISASSVKLKISE